MSLVVSGWTGLRSGIALPGWWLPRSQHASNSPAVTKESRCSCWTRCWRQQRPSFREKLWCVTSVITAPNWRKRLDLPILENPNFWSIWKLYFNSYLIIDISNVTFYQKYEKETWHLERATSSLELSWKKSLSSKPPFIPKISVCSLLHLKTLMGVIKSHAKAKVTIKGKYYCVCSPKLAWFPSQCGAHLLKDCKRKEKKSRCVSTLWMTALVLLEEDNINGCDKTYLLQSSYGTYNLAS